MVGTRVGVVLVAAVAAAAACVPPPPEPTTVRITTELVVCGGVIPPPGEPFCRPPSRGSRTVDVVQGRTVVATVTTGADGTAEVAVEPGTVRVVAVDPPVYLDCDDATTTAVVNVTTPVTQTCTLYAP